MLPALNDISKNQANRTQDTLDACQRLLDYARTYPEVSVRYKASKMILNIETDAAYLVLPKAKSRLAGYFYLGHHRHAQARRSQSSLNAKPSIMWLHQQQNPNPKKHPGSRAANQQQPPHTHTNNHNNDASAHYICKKGWGLCKQFSRDLVFGHHRFI